MICRHCGKNIPDDVVYCPLCGKKIESHLRKEDSDKDLQKYKKRRHKKNVDEYEQPEGKRGLKTFLSVIAAIAFVVAAFIIVMVLIKTYSGETPWPEDREQAEETAEEIGFPKNMYISAEDGLVLLMDPSAEGKAIHLLNYGREIQVEKIADGWAYTTVDGLSGWCSAEYLTENKDEIVVKETKPASDADKGKLVEPTRIIGNGYHGTVNSEGGLNLRCGPGPDYDILLVIPFETEVIEQGWDNGWIYVKYDGESGWVNSEFITPTGEVENVSQ